MVQYVLRCKHGASGFTVVYGENFFPVMQSTVLGHWERHGCECDLSVSNHRID